MSRLTPQKVFDKLVTKGIVRGSLIAYPDGTRVRHALRAGKEIPEHCLPGRVVMDLPEEERTALRELTAEMTQDRPVFTI
jgi:hypothetical protein